MRDGGRRIERAFVVPAALAILCLIVLRAAPLTDALRRNLAGRDLVRVLSPEGLSEDNAFLDATVYRTVSEYRLADGSAADLQLAAALSGGAGGHPLVQGVARLALSQDDEALAVLSQASGDRFSAFWAAIAAEKTGDQARAEAVWRDLKAAPLLAARARRQLAAGQLEEAERSAALAVDVCAAGGCSAPAEGWAVLGAVHRQAGRSAQAEAAFRQAVALVALPEYREGLALSALDAGHAETAREVLLGLTTDYPHMTAYRQWLARANEALGIKGEP